MFTSGSNGINVAASKCYPSAANNGYSRQAGGFGSAGRTFPFHSRHYANHRVLQFDTCFECRDTLKLLKISICWETLPEWLFCKPAEHKIDGDPA
jgi:hypothetical protein